MCSNTLLRRDQERRPFLGSGDCRTSSGLALQMKSHVDSKKRRLPWYRLVRCLRKNAIVVGFTCLFFVCLMIGIQLGQMLAGDDNEGDGARSTLRKPQQIQPLYSGPYEDIIRKQIRQGPQDVVRPYDQHWATYLPINMTKDPNIYLQSVSKDKEICLVNVGQAAEYVACGLGFQTGCGPLQNYNDLPTGLLPQHTTHAFQRNIYDCFDDSAYYLFVVRNPLDRLILAFNRDSTSKLHVDCQFDTVDRLVDMGLSPRGGANATCKDWAVASVEGTELFELDSYFNYQFYLEGIPSMSRIMTIRSEHAAEDWNTIEHAIGGSKDVVSDKVFFNMAYGKDKSVEKIISGRSRNLLCYHLCNEIQVYKKILSVSVNLNEEQVQQTIKELKESCPVEATASSCDSSLPDIKQKLYDNRGYFRNQTLDKATNLIVIGRPVHPSPQSPFEMLWPGLKLPSYMFKDRQYDIESVPADKKVCFVHVGKTAGSTVGCSIGFNLHCESKVQAPGVFPQYATNMFHAQMYDCDDASAFFVFVVRHPLDRWISSFNYDNPSKDWERFRREYGDKHFHYRHKLYAECPFSTVDDIGKALSAESNVTAVCKGRAEASIKGTDHFGCHHYFNYQFHLEAIPKNAKIMTLRTEHLMEDWNSVEYNLGGVEKVFGLNNTVISHNNVNLASDEKSKYLSHESKRLICAKLCNEIQNYKKILRLSINLSEEQVQESVDELGLGCPKEAFATTCNDPMPNITDKLIQGRGYLNYPST